MSLQTKYQELIDAVKLKAAGEIKVAEQDNILYIDGTVNTEGDKDALWEVYNKLDPDYRAGDLRLNLEVSPENAYEEYVVKSGDMLSKIGAKFGVSWKSIVEANKDVIKNPDLIQPGWKLKIPKK
ncbi:MAG: LysM domain-containing protein [Flavitalea sp.]